MEIKMKKCDGCGKLWEDVSPPSEESYREGRIEVGLLSALIPPSVVERRHKHGVSDSHCFRMEEKDFCSLGCFLKYLKKEVE